MQDSLENIERELTNPRTHEGIELRLIEIPREIFACKHELGKDKISIFTKIVTEHISDSDEVSDPEQLSNKIRENEPYLVEVKIGDRDELHVADRSFMIDDPFRGASGILAELSDIEDEFGATVNESNDPLIPDLKSQLELVIQRHSEQITHNDEFPIQTSQDKSAEEIGTAVFERTFHYNRINEDLEDLRKVREEIDNLRMTILQTSYS